MNNLRVQDLQLTNIDLYSQFKLLYENRQYSEAFAILHNEILSTQTVNSNNINILANNIIELENLNEPNFKDNKIITSDTPPVDIKTGEVWFNTIKEV